jgi:hypothetical protein
MQSADKKVAILQSNYIPWKGFFDLINRVDEFILYDDMQYTRRDWRNRNRIKTAQGLCWLTIPVQVKGKYHQRIRDTRISDAGWAEKHWRSIKHHYGRAPFFNEYREIFEWLYRGNKLSYLSEVNYRFLRTICGLLGVTTRISWSMDYTLVEGKTERLVNLCQQARAAEYISGPAARDYIDESVFSRAGIRLSWMDYSGYAEYPQCFESFEHKVSIIDLLFNTGPQATRYMKTFSDSLALAGC